MKSPTLPRASFGILSAFFSAMPSFARVGVSAIGALLTAAAFAVPAPTGPSTINYSPIARIIQGTLTVSETYQLTITGLVTASPTNPVSIDLGFTVLSAPVDTNGSTAYALDFIAVTDAAGNPTSSIITSTTGTFVAYITVSVPTGSQVGDYLWKIKPQGYPLNNGWPDNAGVVIDTHDGATVNAKILPQEQEQIPLEIVTQPFDQDVVAGTDVTFVVVATGNEPLSYQWRKGLTIIPGATSATLTLPNVSTLDAGDYTVLVTDQFNSLASNVAVLTVTKADATVTLSDLSHVYDGTVKAATATTAPAGLPVTLSYTFNGNPATPLNAGSYPVTATINDARYVGSASDTLVIAKAPQTIAFNPLGSKLVTDPAFQLSATASSGLSVSYTSSNPAVATVSGSTVTIVGIGTTTITASQPGNNNYHAAADVERTLTVTAKLDQTITFPALANKTVGDAPFALSATASSSLPVSYTSSNPAVATVSGNVVTIHSAGSTVITAFQPGNSLYNAAVPVSRTLHVSAPVAKDISGEVFFDVNYDGDFNSFDFGLAHITVKLLNASNQVIDTETTDLEGRYTFSSVEPGSYVIVATSYAGLSATNSNEHSVTVTTTDVTVPDIGFGLNFKALCKLTADGRSHGFWKKNIDKAIAGKTSGTQVSAAKIKEYTLAIGDFALAPYDDLTMKEASKILNSSSSKPADLLSKQLIAAEYNYQHGAYINGDAALTFVFVVWGERVLVNAKCLPSSYVLWAKDWFDAYNNSYGGVIDGPSW